MMFGSIPADVFLTKLSPYFLFGLSRFWIYAGNVRYYYYYYYTCSIFSVFNFYLVFYRLSYFFIFVNILKNRIHFFLNCDFPINYLRAGTSSHWKCPKRIKVFSLTTNKTNLQNQQEERRTFCTFSVFVSLLHTNIKHEDTELGPEKALDRKLIFSKPFQNHICSSFFHLLRNSKIVILSV